MPKPKKIYAFIDSQNVHLGVKSQGWTLNFSRFRTLLTEKYHVNKAFLFIGYIKKNQKLYDSLKKANFICIFKPTLEYKKGKSVQTKGNVDAELVLYSMIEYPNYTKAIIVSGDGDFHCLVEYLNKKNKLLKIIVPNKKYSSLLRKFSNYIVNINSFKEKLKT